jgi:1-acyl-sn-glycerol-3-phosphate acyltransferase
MRHNRRMQNRDWLRPFRILWRLPLLLLHVTLGLAITVVLLGPLGRALRWRGEPMDQWVLRTWSRLMVRAFGMRVRRVGAPLPGAAMFVANHVSWIDIVLMHSQRALGFVAKSEIERWPLIGWLATQGGTIYHHRGDNESLHGVMHQMLQRLQDGKAVGVFPEGRTCDGREINNFHARIFQPAVLAQVPVQPVALKYGAGGDAQTVIAFRKRENFIQNFWRLLGEPGRPVEVHFLEPASVDGEGRRRLALVCRDRIIAAMAAA